MGIQAINLIDSSNNFQTIQLVKLPKCIIHFFLCFQQLTLSEVWLDGWLENMYGNLLLQFNPSSSSFWLDLISKNCCLKTWRPIKSLEIYEGLAVASSYGVDLCLKNCFTKISFSSPDKTKAKISHF